MQAYPIRTSYLDLLTLRFKNIFMIRVGKLKAQILLNPRNFVPPPLNYPLFLFWALRLSSVVCFNSASIPMLRLM